MSELKTTSLSHKDNDTGTPNITMYADGTTAIGLTHTGGLKNQLINGGMDVWQRATTYENTSTDAWLYRTVDRWSLSGSQTDEGETKQVTSTAGSLTGMPPGFSYAFAYWDKTDTSTRSSFCQAVELAESGGNCRGAGPFIPGSQWTLSCYCSADITSIEARMDFSDSVQNVNSVSFGAAANWVQIEAPTATRWGRYAVTFTGSSNDFNTTTRCMRVVLGAIGTQSTPADFTSVSSRVGITGCQLEPGPVATRFEQRPIGLELSLCQRYYIETNYDDGTGFIYLYQHSPTSRSATGFFPVHMRADPTLSATISYGTVGASAGTTQTYYVKSNIASGTSDSSYLTSLTADAEL